MIFEKNNNRRNKRKKTKIAQNSEGKKNIDRQLRAEESCEVGDTPSEQAEGRTIPVFVCICRSLHDTPQRKMCRILDGMLIVTAVDLWSVSDVVVENANFFLGRGYNAPLCLTT